ncbi:MAG: hypothetical protein APF81_09420 [Desulfosporosinus sp. BRH_c37]|nr:MAG: hypothetical protein APF81_09420 [Desulfosporosinus sp. BRH_c37]
MNESVGQEDKIEIRIPSRTGYEKVAMVVAEVIAQKMGMPEARREDLSTALSEAILNAMEHGNQMNEEQQVVVTFSLAADKLLVAVSDQGQGFHPPEGMPNLEDKIEGNSPARGWGWFLMEQLVDQVEVVPSANGGTSVRLVVMLEGKVTQTNG